VSSSLWRSSTVTSSPSSTSTPLLSEVRTGSRRSNAPLVTFTTSWVPVDSVDLRREPLGTRRAMHSFLLAQKMPRPPWSRKFSVVALQPQSTQIAVSISCGCVWHMQVSRMRMCACCMSMCALWCKSLCSWRDVLCDLKFLRSPSPPLASDLHVALWQIRWLLQLILGLVHGCMCIDCGHSHACAHVYMYRYSQLQFVARQRKSNLRPLVR
jgi:hypothetical protein